MKSMKSWLPFRREEPKAMERPTGGGSDTFVEMRREMDRVFDRFLREPFGMSMSVQDSPLGERWFGDFSPARFAPQIDIADEKDHVRVTAELPGIDPKDVEVKVHNDVLVLRGEKKVEEAREEGGFYRTERSYGAFHRTIPLPVEVDEEKTGAAFKNGVLTVRLPKAAGVTGPKQVPIRAE